MAAFCETRDAVSIASGLHLASPANMRGPPVKPCVLAGGVGVAPFRRAMVTLARLDGVARARLGGPRRLALFLLPSPFGSAVLMPADWGGRGTYICVSTRPDIHLIQLLDAEASGHK